MSKTKKKATIRTVVHTRNLREQPPADEPETEQPETADEEATPSPAPAAAPHNGSIPTRRLSKLPIEQLQAIFREEIQRDTESTSKTYLIHMIREARAGRVRIGPRASREKKGPIVHLPLRMQKDEVPILDEVWERLGMVSRSEFFRQALHRHLTDLGEPAAAALFAESEDA